MPAATTHALNALDVYENLDKSKKNEIKNLPMFCLGAQGPDLFFFYNFGASSEIKKIGNYLHVNKVYEVIKYMYDYIYKNNKLNLLSYFYGYLCHYALDSIAHPIVYHRSKFGNLTNEAEIVIHFRVEAFYDRYVLSKKQQKFNTDSLLKVSKDDALEIATMFHNLFKDILNKDIEIKELEKNCRQTSLILKLLKPNNKLKFYLTELVENFTNKPKMVSSLMLYNDFNEKNNYVLNKNKEEFKNITDSSIKYNYSFDELYELGIKKGVTLINNPLDESQYNLTFDGNPISTE